jgi:hypothetical protein
LAKNDLAPFLEKFEANPSPVFGDVKRAWQKGFELSILM